MSDQVNHDVTLLLSKWSGGDKAALEELMPLIYGELKRLAGSIRWPAMPGELQITSEMAASRKRVVEVMAVDQEVAPIRRGPIVRILPI